MVGTIIPIVYGDQKNGSRVLGLHIAAYILGAMILGTVLGSFGHLITGIRDIQFYAVGVIGVTSLFCSTRELELIAFPLPEAYWQVPSKWRTLPLRAMATIYGLVLGVGVANRVRVSTFHVAALWAFLSGNPFLAACVLSAFGFGRALPIIWMTRRSQTASECFSITESAGSIFPIVRALSGLLLAFAGACLLSAWLTRYGA
jgi:hypothetical protein